MTDALGLAPRTASGTSAVWLQLLWVAAVYGLLRSLALSPARAAAWTTVIGLSGFCVQNTVFTWPKLSAAALALGAFGLWVLAPFAPRRAPRLIGAGLAALAWLSHGGVAFSFLALVPWLVWRVWRGEFREWLLAAAVFLLFALPWTGYQKFYEPPGDQLVKLHLAGQDGPDGRTAWQSIRAAYQKLSWTEILERRRVNLGLQIKGDFRRLVDFSPAGANGRRADEFFHPARALTWWLSGGVAFLVVALQPSRRRWLAANGPALLALTWWPLLTALVWCALMFVGMHAVIHQGSYAMMLAYFVLLSVGLEFANRWSLAVIAVLQAVTLATTYGVSNALVHGPPIGLPAVVAAGAAAAWVIARGFRTGNGPARFAP